MLVHVLVVEHPAETNIINIVINVIFFTISRPSLLISVLFRYSFETDKKT